MATKKNTESKAPILFDVSDAADHLFEAAGLDEDGNRIIWDEDPVNVEEFVKGPQYLNLGKSVRKNVMDDLLVIFGEDPYRIAPLCNYAIFSEAVGTGKTFRQSIMAIYMAYKLLCLRDPVDYFNTLNIPGQPKLAPNSKLAVILMAVTEKNARKVIYIEVGNKIFDSPWFKKKYPPKAGIRTELQFDPRPEEMGKAEDRVYKNVYIIPGSSSEYAAVGYNIILGVIDEATLFEDVKDASLQGGADRNDQAEVVYNTLDARIKSRYGSQGLLVIAGNPKHEEDFLERHAADAEGDEKSYIVLRRSVWASTMPEFDPDLRDENGEAVYPHFYFHLHSLEIVDDSMKNQAGVIPIPMLYYDDFRRKPEIAKRDLAGWPTSAVGRVIPNPNLVTDRANKDRKDPLASAVDIFLPDPIQLYLAEWFTRKDCVWHGCHIDIGETGDAAALCVSHVEGYNEAGDPKIYTDLFVRWKGTAQNRVEIDQIYHCIRYLHDSLYFDFGWITADRYQSSYLLERLKSDGFQTGVLSVDKSNDPYDELILSIKAKRNDYYKNVIAIRELTNLERRKGKYDHPRRGSKDVSDAWAGSVYNAIRCSTYGPPVDRRPDAGGGVPTSRARIFGGTSKGRRGRR